MEPNDPPILPSKLNYYAKGVYLRSNPRRGTLHNRAGRRMLAMTDDFWLGLWHAILARCEPQAPRVLYACGQRCGSEFARQFRQEMTDYWETPLADFPLYYVETLLVEALANHGWGQPQFDWSRYAQGIVVVAVRHLLFQSLLPESEFTKEYLFSGFLAGIFSELFQQQLACFQTDRHVQGSEVGRFVITSSERMRKLQDLLPPSATHEQTIELLSQIRLPDAIGELAHQKP